MSLSGSIATLTIPEIRKGLIEGQFSAKELAEAAVAHAQTENVKTNAFLTFSPERALQAAERVDNSLAAGSYVGALAGVPGLCTLAWLQKRRHFDGLTPAKP